MNNLKPTAAAASILVLVAGLGIAACEKDKPATNTATTARPTPAAAPVAAPAAPPSDTSLVGDAAVTAKIKTKMVADDDVKAYQINVDTKDGAVTLTGTVDTKVQASKAERLAKDTEGVKSVTNNLAAKS